MRIAPIVLGLALVATGALCGSAGAQRAQRHYANVTESCYKGQESKGLGHRIKEDARDTTDALGVTPRVKKSILEDGRLNDRRNLINVDTKDYVVHLRGHVYSQSLKERAGHVAAVKLAKIGKRYKVSNELSVGR
jgi:osmotically-inducible protein OsmY